MAVACELSLEIPATSAHLGPGFGVLAVALDLPTTVSVETGVEDGITIDHKGPGGCALIDKRHDAVRRGMLLGAERFSVKLPPKVHVTVDSEVPRGAGLGTRTAGFAAGVAIAGHLAKEPPSPNQKLALIVELGGDPAHAAAALSGGLAAVVLAAEPTGADRTGGSGQPRVLQLPLHDSWRFVIACPQVRIATAEARRVLPPTVPHHFVPRTSGRLLALLQALATGDATELGEHLVDDVHVPFRRHLVPGLDRAIEAAIEAGAAGATLSGHGPGILAFVSEDTPCAGVAAAMQDTFTEVGQPCQTLIAAAATSGIAQNS